MLKNGSLLSASLSHAQAARGQEHLQVTAALIEVLPPLVGDSTRRHAVGGESHQEGLDANALDLAKLFDKRGVTTKAGGKNTYTVSIHNATELVVLLAKRIYGEVL